MDYAIIERLDLLNQQVARLIELKEQQLGTRSLPPQQPKKQARQAPQAQPEEDYDDEPEMPPPPPPGRKKGWTR